VEMSAVGREAGRVCATGWLYSGPVKGLQGRHLDHQVPADMDRSLEIPRPTKRQSTSNGKTARPSNRRWRPNGGARQGFLRFTWLNGGSISGMEQSGRCMAR
jgi:hypothetical protein